MSKRDKTKPESGADNGQAPNEADANLKEIQSLNLRIFKLEVKANEAKSAAKIARKAVRNAEKDLYRFISDIPQRRLPGFDAPPTPSESTRGAVVGEEIDAAELDAALAATSVDDIDIPDEIRAELWRHTDGTIGDVVTTIAIEDSNDPPLGWSDDLIVQVRAAIDRRRETLRADTEAAAQQAAQDAAAADEDAGFFGGDKDDDPADEHVAAQTGTTGKKPRRRVRPGGKGM